MGGGNRAATTGTPVLGYWGIRGLAEPIRLLHVLLALPLEERVYTRPAQWADDRARLATPFPNLPHYVDADGATTRCETACILEHLCAANGAPLHAPGAEREHQCFHFLMGCHEALRAFCYGYVPQTATREAKARTGKTGTLALAQPQDAAAYRHVVRDQIAQCVALCDAGRPFVHGAAPGVCDALLYCLVETARAIELDAARDDAATRAFVDAFSAVPAVADYLAARTPLPLHAPFVPYNAVC